MIELVENPWSALAQLCRSHSARRIEILTGFIGSGAASALAALNVQARIVIGLAGANASLSRSQIEELKLLSSMHEVRWLPGLHAKMYLIDRRAVMVGSANFSKGGFESLDEIAIATDDAEIIARATQAFEARFAQAERLDASQLTTLADDGLLADEDEPSAFGLGLAWFDRKSGFSVPAYQPSAAANEPARFMFANIAEGRHRCWADCRRYGFVAAGQGPRWSLSLRQLRVGDRVYAYLEGWGFVGLGTVTGAPRMAKDYVVQGHGPLFELELTQPNIASNADDPNYCEWVVPVEWQKTFDAQEARCKAHFRRGHAVCRIRKQAALEQLAEAFR